jgi:hypothetical protein
MQAQPEKQFNPIAVIDGLIDAAAQHCQIAAAARARLEREACCAVLFQPRDQ